MNEISNTIIQANTLDENATQSLLFVIFFNSHGRGGAFGRGTPASLSLFLRALPISHAAVPLLRPQTSPTAANKSMHSLEGLNWLEMPNSEAA